MYNREQITDAFRGVIGVRPSMDYGNERARLDAQIVQSSHDMYINDLHKMFRVENFVDAMDNFYYFDPMPYENGKTFYKGNVVKDLDTGSIYECLKTNNIAPLSDPEYWLETTMISVRFREIINASVHETISDLIEMKKAGRYGRTLKGSTALYRGVGVRSNRIKKSGRFVGYLMRIREDGIIVKLNRIGLQLTDNCVVPIYLYSSDQTFELAKWSFNFNLPGKFKYDDAPHDLILNDAFNYYIIGYYEDDLPPGVDAIEIYNTIFQVSSGCQSCNSSELAQKSVWGPFIEVVPVSIDGAKPENGMTWSEEDMVKHENTNFGLNLAMSFMCDMTNLFIDQIDSFIPAIMAKLQLKLLQELAYKRRNNAAADENQNLAYSILWNDSPKVLSPEQIYHMKLQGLDFEFSGINKRCLPEQFSGSISWGTV